jgi:hypothetical protein
VSDGLKIPHRSFYADRFTVVSDVAELQQFSEYASKDARAPDTRDHAEDIEERFDCRASQRPRRVRTHIYIRSCMFTAAVRRNGAMRAGTMHSIRDDCRLSLRREH